jgi:hypothetical protein
VIFREFCAKIAMASGEAGVFRALGRGTQKKIAKTNAAIECKTAILRGCNEVVES